MQNYLISSYSIFIKLENSDGQYMLLHGYTGALDIVHEDIATFLQSNRNQLDPSNFPFDTKIWETLINRGYITQKSKTEEREHVIKLANLLHKRNKLLHNYFTFIITYDCNFRCPYCYEAHLSNHGLNWTKKKFTKEMVDKAYKAIDTIENRDGYHSKTILLYGGEPLLKENIEIIEYIVQQGVSKGFVFNVITNGYDLEFYQDLIGKGKISFLQITLDGVEETHDKRRRHYKGEKTFDRIFNNILLALSRDAKVAVRVNTDESNIDDIARLKAMFDIKGVLENPNLVIQSALLVDYLHGDNVTETKKQFDQENDLHYMPYIEFVSKHKSENFDVQFDDRGTSRLLYTAIKNKSVMPLKSTYCAAQHGSYALDPYGYIYGCLESIGFPKSSIGKYNGTQVEWNALKEKWHSRNSGNLEKCSQCKYTFLCKGGCLNQILKNGGDFTDSRCDGFGPVLNTVANLIYDRLFLNHEIA